MGWGAPDWWIYIQQILRRACHSASCGHGRGVCSDNCVHFITYRYVQWAAAYMQGAWQPPWFWERGREKGLCLGSFKEKANRVSSSSWRRRKRVADKDRHEGRRQGRRGWLQFEEWQDSGSEKNATRHSARRCRWRGRPQPTLRGLLAARRPRGLAAVARELCQQDSDMSCSSPIESHRKLFPGLSLAAALLVLFF